MTNPTAEPTAPARTEAPVLCLGEALVDIIIRDDQILSEHVGGSPLNVACGITQLGHPALIASWWGDDERGRAIEAHATKHTVGIVPGSDKADRTAIANAHLDAQGRATYDFELVWDVPELPPAASLAHLHTGSFAATLEPGAAKVLAAVKRMAINGTVSYDPNVRPALMESPEKVLGRVEDIVALSDVVKASDEDVAWLYGDTPVEEVMRRWIKMGPGLVIVTRGPWGAYALLSGDRDMMVVDPLNVEVADTVGAGDSFMAGLLSGLLDADLLGSPLAKAQLRSADWSQVRTALHRAVITSGLTVSRSGAYAPRRDEVQRVLAVDPLLR
ncbi:5-dehydro-2-deoxygluconokinase [bioreactor metagenome]|uniref:Carbohydrate kinase n=2 Tax=root TaxID=1 RepID=A0AAN0MG47_9ACTN|nr:carbohydrate kinase [Brooklawnia sp. SH051]MCB0884324.1 carbohydrate kinase [Propionibacteriaceae bacterium]NLI85996.1 carbohydrate kinase [Propionibacterium sp.]BEH01872.1 carbohydrate kinase [Brooklawnia sp. SH051]